MNKNRIQYTAHRIQRKNNLFWFLVFIVAINYELLTINYLYCQIHKEQFENGFVFIHQEKTGVGLASVNLFIKGGAVNEKNEEAGVTSLMTQVLPRGTINRNSEKIAEESESLGATISASCANDYIEVSLMVLSENFDSAFEIFADIVNNPTFPEEEFEKEKVKTIAGIKSKMDHIFEVAYDKFNELIFKKYPYHIPVSGYEATVSSLTVVQISDIYRKNFRPENMILSINGDINYERAKKIVEKYFKNVKIIGAEEVVSENISYNKKLQTKPIREIHPSKFQQAYIFIGFLAPDISKQEYAIFKLINTIIGSGMGSRLFNALREESGLVYESSSFYPSRKIISGLIMYAGTSKENIDIVEKKLNEEMNKISEVSDEELKNAKEYLKGTYLIDHRTMQRQSWWNGFWEVMDKNYNYDKKYLEEVEQVTVSDIKEVFKKYYSPEKTITLILK
ncbi:MAG: hypothetical protein A2551_04270 [Elusimicrobia bacterium RIFOXYD2_FULL_34_30]|nr:MAG: hypothetical protein A2551_04270 [Elusimicrobia bacterium RIFOXYD2_FULL_34_30]